MNMIKISQYVNKARAIMSRIPSMKAVDFTVLILSHYLVTRDNDKRNKGSVEAILEFYETMFNAVEIDLKKYID